MKKYSAFIFTFGLVLTILISNVCASIRDGRKLDELRGSVLRLHILADSDSEMDQWLKMKVRDELLRKSDYIFSDADSLEEAEKNAGEKLDLIEQISESVLRRYGCKDKVKAEITNVDFDERVYGDITMPAGNYKALRVSIGSARGHNWWCVMYPPLCIPAVCGIEDDKETEEEFFDDEELDIMYHPKKYQVRFAVWDKIKSWLDF